MKENLEKILSTASAAAAEAAKIIMDLQSRAKVNYKGTNNLVTEADVKSEAAIREIILKTFPNHSICGEEEGGEENLNSSNLWIIDPLDGTNNFAHGFPFFSVSIAYAEHGEVKMGYILDPIRNECFHAAAGGGAFLNNNPIHVSDRPLEQAIIGTGFYYDRGEIMKATLRSVEKLFENNARGMRRTGSAALDICYVAAGRLDGFFEYKLGTWDFAAGMLIVKEAGGLCNDAAGNQMTLNSKTYVFSNGCCTEELLKIVRYPEKD